MLIPFTTMITSDDSFCFVIYSIITVFFTTLFQTYTYCTNDRAYSNFPIAVRFLEHVLFFGTLTYTLTPMKKKTAATMRLDYA